jgi:abhydrolase domain-containing protein 17
MNIILVEYPGYSIYKETKGAQKVLDDSVYVYDYLTHKLNVEPNHIYVFGRSIGSAPSCFLASQREFGGLILMSPFTSIQSVAKNLVGFISFLVAER